MRKLFIFDTSVVLQAMLSRRSLAFTALRKADNDGIIVVSDATISELQEKYICLNSINTNHLRIVKRFLELTV
jgi:predicted nucleic acid-binding protein